MHLAKWSLTVYPSKVIDPFKDEADVYETVTARE